jgi:predicted RNA methylase
MDKKQFYPTPYKLARKMVDILCGEKYYLGNKTILEPSAGDGAILDLLTNRRVQKENIICCEVDYDRQAILRSKGYNIVGFDFLLDNIAYTPQRIIMNPPFRQGVNHVVKAWNMLAEGGRLVAIINAANLRVENPSFNTHVLIKAINEYGSVEYLKDEFIDKLSRRKTNVEVALIVLDKPKSEEESFLNQGFERIKEAIETEESQTSSALVVKAIIPQLVARYNASVSAFKTMEKAISEFRLVANVFDGKGNAGDVKIQKPSYNEFVRNLTKQAWEQIFEKSEFRNMVTQKVKKELNQHFDSCSTIAFNERNIVALLEQLAIRYDSLMEDCLVESFNNFTSTHKENREHKEGWITNSQWLLTRKLIYPAYYPNRYDSCFDIAHSRVDIFDDLDRALCYLAGKKMDNIVSIRGAVRAEKKDREEYNKSDEATEPKSMFSMTTRSTFFKIKTHKKGTIWLTFDYTLDNGDDIRDRFNYIVAQKLGFPLRGKDFKERK